MNKRIAKKRAARMCCRALSLPFTLDFARRSFYSLGLGTQRALLIRRMRLLGVHARMSHPAVRQWAP